MNVYIPHLRRLVALQYDREDWPFVPFDNETEDERARRLDSLGWVHRYGQHWLEVPRPDEEDAYREYQRAAHEQYMFDMAIAGWWDVGRRDGGAGGIFPVRKMLVFLRNQFRAGDTLAHVMQRAKFFETVGDARRNGWNKAIEPGLYAVGKQRDRVLVLGEMPPEAPVPDEVWVHAHFDQGEDLVIHMRNEVGDWGCWCRRWTGETYEGYWRYFDHTTRAHALEQTRHEIAYAVRWEPSGVDKRLKVAVVMPQIKRLDTRRYEGLAEQAEQSRASIDGRAPRKLAGVTVR